MYVYVRNKCNVPRRETES